MDVFQTKPIFTAVSVVGVTLLGYFFTRLYAARMLMVKLQKQGCPVAPGHSFLFGHLLLLGKMFRRLPKDAHYQYMFGEIYRDHFESTGTNTLIAARKVDLLARFFKPIAGGPCLFDMPEESWRPWRAVFNKAFNNDYFQKLVPGMVKQIEVYKDILREHAEKGDMFYLDTTTLRFTMDLIGKTIMNTEFHAQRGYNVLADSMISQIRWHEPAAAIDPFSRINMDAYIIAELDRRYAEYKADSKDSRSKAIIDLILRAEIAPEADVKPEKLDPDFKAFAIRQIRLFVFSGHDSLSSTICYVYHLLSKNVEAMQKVREEHDLVFGKQIDGETLRLFPAASSSRQGYLGVTLYDEQGTACPTKHAVCFIDHVGMHRAPRYWVRPEEFLPERWLVDPGHELYPVKGAWRPFEYGPRNCIAQGLVMTELRVLLACTVREFVFEDAYEEWDRSHKKKGPQTHRGERAYQIEEAAAHPSVHYPCRVRMMNV
ncbi:putative afln vera monooxygenase protein [Botrytis fragariae]|uniref:Putative afln vera monooxygenase protein n=1 Tax=Botrytis fragariae TaxID=1964551 RepID=A0A8H6AMA7_9HELO|nr:putative afln vera monooxygenase protein [Botrytis fragariae]KAF5869938.1 putative afln vera monooxygenase protein [Botrytis fragariae]